MDSEGECNCYGCQMGNLIDIANLAVDYSDIDCLDRIDSLFDEKYLLFYCFEDPDLLPD